MCGRFTQADIEQLDREVFKLLDLPSWDARYNVAPTHDALVIRHGKRGRSIAPLRWGLIPSWADDPKIAMRTINARAESVADKPAFKESFRQRRCVIPVSGFYEWKKAGSIKQPYYIHPAATRHFALAGLWDQWFSHTEGPIETFTIITVDANDALVDLHDRMPAILSPTEIEAWLDPDVDDSDRLRRLLHPAASTLTTFYAVSTYVNKVENEGEACIDPTESP